MKGKVTQWMDNQGFGFITPDDGSEKVFFHISSVKTNARRPQVGDCVLFEAERDPQQRLKARGVVIDGVTLVRGRTRSPVSSRRDKVTSVGRRSAAGSGRPKRMGLLTILFLIAILGVIYDRVQNQNFTVPSFPSPSSHKSNSAISQAYA
ncbi:MAG: cold shock domain-containing protein, partial [Porticoccus sp.]